MLGSPMGASVIPGSVGLVGMAFAVLVSVGSKMAGSGESVMNSVEAVSMVLVRVIVTPVVPGNVTILVTVTAEVNVEQNVGGFVGVGVMARELFR